MAFGKIFASHHLHQKRLADGHIKRVDDGRPKNAMPMSSQILIAPVNVSTASKKSQHHGHHLRPNHSVMPVIAVSDIPAQGSQHQKSESGWQNRKTPKKRRRPGQFVDQPELRR